MRETNRKLRRAALLSLPGHSLKESVLDEIAAGGFTDVGATVSDIPLVENQQGYTLEQGRQLAEMCGRRGLGFIAATGYQAHPDPLVEQEPQRMMLTSDGKRVHGPDEVPDLSLCPFRPENKAWYLDQLMEICTWPAVVEVHINDEASLGWFGNWVMGCYCDYCQTQFRAITGTDPPVKRDWDDPLWYTWLEHRFDNWMAVHAEFRDAIKKVRPEVQVGQQHSPAIPERMYNAWVYGVSLARETQSLDVGCTDPYHFNHAEEIGHRPHRRILTEGTRSLMGASFDRQVDIYPQGFMPPKRATPMGRQDGLLAGVVPFALGADLIVPYTYEQMKIIPGFFEAFQEARRLVPVFETHRPYAFATMLMPHQSEVTGHYDSHWGSEHLWKVVDLFYRTGIPWRWFWDGRLEDASGHLRGPLVLPEVHCLTEGQLELVREVGRRGEGLLWIGNVPREPWEGRGACKLPTPIEYGAFEVTLEGDHPIVSGLTDPVILNSRVDWSGPEGEVIGTIEGRAALTLVEEEDRREVWIAGTPATEHRHGKHSWANVPTSNVELLRRLVTWTADAQPLVRLDPFPPIDDYRTLRPADRRAVPTIELLPMVKDGPEGSILAVVFPYTPVGCETRRWSSSCRRRQGCAA